MAVAQYKNNFLHAGHFSDRHLGAGVLRSQDVASGYATTVGQTAEQFTTLGLDVYLKQLTTQAFHTQVIKPCSIRLCLDLASVKVGMNQATSCGQLVNELVASCLKQDYPAGHTGEIRVELQSVDDGQHMSGTGLVLLDDFEAKWSNSLGLQQVPELARKTGWLNIEPRPAAMFVTFTAESRQPAFARRMT